MQKFHGEIGDHLRLMLTLSIPLATIGRQAELLKATNGHHFSFNKFCGLLKAAPDGAALGSSSCLPDQPKSRC
jgi:hypothetical protein